MSMDQAEKDMRGAVDFLAAQDGVERLRRRLGRLLPRRWAVRLGRDRQPQGRRGGHLLLRDAARQARLLEARRCPVLGHFGTADDFVPVEDAKALEREIAEASGQDVKFEFYEGAGHAFFNDTDRLGTYDEDAAERSWQRTVGVLQGDARLSVAAGIAASASPLS